MGRGDQTCLTTRHRHAKQDPEPTDPTLSDMKDLSQPATDAENFQPIVFPLRCRWTLLLDWCFAVVADACLGTVTVTAAA